MDVPSIFEKFSEKRVLVIGDVMIDAYVEGKVTRISPEAPVPIVNLSNRSQRLGGAANVALNLISLGAKPILTSVVGDDNGGDTLVRLMGDTGMDLSGIERSKSRKTTVKTRVIGNSQQLLRIDDEVVSPLTQSEEDVLLNNVRDHIKEVDAIIFEDYNKGILTPIVIRAIIELANENNVITTVDPKKENFFEYQNVTLFKPNLKELKEGLNVDFDLKPHDKDFEKSITELESRLSNKISFVTLSEHGVFIKDSSQKHYIPAHIRNISDVSGAGDTVISVATLCLAIGMPIRDAAAWANLAGGLVCEKSGVVPIDKAHLRAEVEKLTKG